LLPANLAIGLTYFVTVARYLAVGQSVIAQYGKDIYQREAVAHMIEVLRYKP